MNHSDYGGFWANRARVDREDAERTIGNWERENQQLRQLLNDADEKYLFRDAEFNANDYVLRLALEALKAANPNSPLLDKSNRDMLRRQHLSAALAPKGYQVDVSTGRVKKNR